MRLDYFLHNLHFDIEKEIPPDWEVDWDDAPLPYKLYRDLPVFQFSLEVPLALEGWQAPHKPDFRKTGHFLWHVFGLTQLSQFQSYGSSEEDGNLMQSFRRFAPSGGALYPNELYVYLKLDDLPVGLYHYDIAHHRLVLLREGNYDSYIARALGDRCDLSSCFGTVFVSTMFWKNFYKYNNFSYRLQGLDAGVLIGQLLEVAERFGFASGVYFQFLDRAINHLLGLSENEESTYAVIPLSVETTSWTSNASNTDGFITATTLCRELPLIHHNHYVRSQRIKEYPMLIKMNEASMVESAQSFSHLNAKENMNYKAYGIALPPVSRLRYDLASVSRSRFSPEMDFVLGKISQIQLAALLQEATASFSYRNDLDCTYKKQEPRVSVYGCLYNVEGITNGAYLYDSTSHRLQQIDSGDYRIELQYGMTIDNVNLQQIPICLHVTGDKGYFKRVLGFRGYRIQQMEAGMLVQRLLLAATALGMGGHPLLGYSVKVCDEIYKLDPLEKTSLIQIPIGPYRDRPWLKGSLQS